MTNLFDLRLQLSTAIPEMLGAISPQRHAGLRAGIQKARPRVI
jgi:hypothetical protein